MPIVRQDWVVRQDLKDNPFKTYLFGDNYERKGFGGQAKEMRGEPNSVGIVTKYSPSNSEDSFFGNSDQDTIFQISLIEKDLRPVINLLVIGRTIVIPSDGLGTGLSRLPEKASMTHAYLEARLKMLEDLFND